MPTEPTYAGDSGIWTSTEPVVSTPGWPGASKNEHLSPGDDKATLVVSNKVFRNFQHYIQFKIISRNNVF